MAGTDNEEDYKIINDPVLEHIKLDPKLFQIIDRPEFQRLRNIKHLGATHYVFPGATNSCFEHAIGTAQLVDDWLRTIKHNQSDLGINDADILNVQRATLCRHLGHGVYSHVYHEIFLPLVDKGRCYSVEDTSIMMFKQILRPSDFGEGDFQFIEDLIRASPRDTSEDGGGRYASRTDKKRFLYQVVRNHVTEFGVDMWDTITRASRFVNINTPFQRQRFLDFTRVIKDGHDHWTMSFRDKLSENCYEAYRSLEMLQKKALKHKTVLAVEQMLAEVLHAAEKSKLIQFEIGDEANKRSINISECVQHPEGFRQLNDSIFYLIETRPNTEKNEDLKKAKEILKRLNSRQLYKCVGRAKHILNGQGLTEGTTKSTRCLNKLLQIETETLDKLRQIDRLTQGTYDILDEEANVIREVSCKIDDTRCELEEIIETEINEKMGNDGNIFVKVIDVGYSKYAAGTDPVKSMMFYTKRKTLLPRKINQSQVSHTLPKTFHDMSVAIFVRNPEVSEAVICAFRQWQSSHSNHWSLCPEIEDNLAESTD